MSIPFTQFLMPDGRRDQVTIQRPAEIEEQAHAIIARGFGFEIEILTTGQISMEICSPETAKKDAVVLTHEICRNGPEVLESVDKMVREAFRVLHETEKVQP